MVVFVAKPDNYDCSQLNSILPPNSKLLESKSPNISTFIELKIKNSITYNEYFIAIGGTTAVLLIIGVVLITVAIITHRYGTISTIHNEGKLF